MPGYDRYFNYASKVLDVPDPLGYLAGREDVYWAIKKYIDDAGLKRDAKILEIGSGLGYLTYALAKRGFDINGLDVSRKAVEKAAAMYGNHYICDDLFEYMALTGPVYDVVIMTEVIEHMPDVKKTLKAVDGLLVQGGEVVITTPNKSAYHDDVLWETDAPPVHLWWFSEQSMTFLADSMGYSIRFVDFTEYNRTHFLNIWYRKNPSLPTRRPVFKADDSLKLGLTTNVFYYSAKFCMRLLRTEIRKVRSLTSAGRRGESRRGTICAVLTKSRFKPSPSDDGR